ncbi:MAG: 4-oxalocrotonate decarboxylase [Pseudomonadota bacterium]
MRPVVAVVLLLFTTSVHANPDCNAAVITGIGRGIPADLTVEAAYFVQATYKAHKRSHGAVVIGYKAGLTSVASQARFEVPSPVSGVLYSDMVMPEETLQLCHFGQPMLEVELGFILARSIKDEADVRLPLSALVSDVVPVIEIPDLSYASRLTGPGIVAANVAARGYLLGPPLATRNPAAINRVRVELMRDSQSLFKGVATDAMGDQVKALRWLLLHRLRQNDELVKGHLLITGALGQMVPAETGRYRAHFSIDETTWDLTFTVL